MASGKRKSWDALSEGYRRRLERFGVTRESHAAGEPLYQARGHFPKGRTDRAAGYEPGPLGTRIRGHREPYWKASEEWQRVRPQLRGLPRPLRDLLRRNILIERRFHPGLVQDIIRIYRDAGESYLDDPRDGERGDIVDQLDSDLFELEYEYDYLGYGWLGELGHWYHVRR